MLKEDLYKAVKIATVESGHSITEKLIEEFNELIEELKKGIECIKAGKHLDVLEIADEIADVIITMEQNSNVRDISKFVDLRKNFKLNRLKKYLETGNLFKQIDTE